MKRSRFGWVDLFLGNRFLIPVSERGLDEAGRAANLAAGETLLDLKCGNGAAAVFWAQTFHVYARGIAGTAEFVTSAQEHADRSPARSRLRFFHDDPAHAAGQGPVDVLVLLRGGTPRPVFLRPGGRIIQGRFVFDTEAPPELRTVFFDEPQADGDVSWSRAATPLEWERFLDPVERALRVHRRGLKRDEDESPIARAAEQMVTAFRAHGSHVSYELAVIVP